MRLRPAFSVVISLLVLVSACSGASEPASDLASEVPSDPASTQRDEVTVPLTLHVVVEAGAPTSALSSVRTAEGLASIATEMAEIWAQADVVLDPINVHVLEMPTPVLEGIAFGNTDAFFDQVNATFIVEDAVAINGFYVRSAFGVNGFTPQGANLFFVVDEPSVFDERVSSHEIGHILGLRHDLEDARQLMFSGTNGIGLSELEQTVARYTAIGLFPQDVDP